MTQQSYYITIFLAIAMLVSCSSNSDDDNGGPNIDDPTQLYFPPLSSSTWETISPQELGWNTNATAALNTLLEEKNTKAFIILKNGRIAMETYFGSFTRDSIWYWASAGKTLTAFTVGIAQENNLLNIDELSSMYLGKGWTSAEMVKENAITVRNQLTMTSGLNDLFFDCVSPDCLRYTADAGTRWAYHNGPYTLLQNVVSAAAGTTFTSYFNTELRDKIGMNGFWLSTNGSNNVYFSNARSMARFGLLNLNMGTWENTVLLGDMNYITSMSTSSQDLNLSYGYLWWLNGKDSYRVPGSQVEFPGFLIPNAPADTYAGLGKNDQKLYIVPEQELVVVRLGEDAGEDQAGPSSFDNELWGILKDLIGY